jgi:hypothetical protein
MATSDGTRPKQKEVEEGELEIFQETQCSIHDQPPNPGDITTPHVYDSLQYQRYRERVEARADVILRSNPDRGMSKSEAVRLAESELSSFNLDSTPIPMADVVQTLSRQQEVLVAMMEKLTRGAAQDRDDESSRRATVKDTEGMSSLALPPVLRNSTLVSSGQHDTSVSPSNVSAIPPVNRVEVDGLSLHGGSAGHGASASRPMGDSNVRPNQTVSVVVDHTDGYGTGVAGSNKQIFEFAAGNSELYKKKPMIPDSFKGDETQSWESYLNQFMVVSHFNHWTEPEACFYLQKSLKGKAADYLFDSPNAGVHSSFDKLVKVLAERFGSADNYSQDSKTLQSRRKLKGETFKELAQSIRQIAGRMYRESEATLEREAKQAFLRAIPDHYKIAVAAIAANPTKSLNDLVNAVKSIAVTSDTPEKDISVGKGRVNQVTVTEEASVNYAGNRGGGTKADKYRDIECYICKEKGHIMRVCPTLPNKDKCRNCFGFGHSPENCPSPKSKRPGNGPKSQ